ncbi:MAG: DUF4838 domain-containing protein [Ferruginibacter sp.]
MDPKLIAEDLADLLRKSTGKEFYIKEYEKGYEKGIFLLLDEKIEHPSNEFGKIESDGKTYIRIKAKYMTGISYAAYSWLKELGFKFYLPGNEWTIIPKLSSPFSGKIIKKDYSPHFKLRSFGKSGDNFPIRSIDEKFNNDSQWLLWYRRNRMGSEYLGIDGHVGEAFNIAHRKEIEKDPSILSPVNGKREFSVEGKLDPTNKKGVSMFADWVIAEFKRKAINKPPGLPLKQYAGVDAGDGLNYCHTPACEKEFRSVSEQFFYITNYVAKKIKGAYKNAGVCTYAYTERADTPSLHIEPNVHVQVVASAFQQVGTTTELMKRWTKKTNNISQYDYLSIGIWSADQPHFNMQRYYDYLQYVKKLGIHGFSYETSFSKFGSGIMQYFVLEYLNKPYGSIENKLEEFCRDNFGNASVPIKKIFKEWYFSEVHLNTQLDFPSFYPDELGRFFIYLEQASGTKGINADIQKRITELKAYCIFLSLFYELRSELNVQRPENHKLKIEKAEELLSFTWSLYISNIFQNSQLNEIIRNHFLPGEYRQKWQYYSNDNFYTLFKNSNAEKIEEEFRKRKTIYSRFASFDNSLPPAFFKNSIKYGADSIQFSTTDEEALGYFIYPVNFYCSKPTSLKIKCETGKSKLSSSSPVALLSIEKEDYSYIDTKYFFKNEADSVVMFNITKPGFFRLYMGQFKGTHNKFTIYPQYSIFYINKKMSRYNFFVLQSTDENENYPNKYLGLYVPPNLDSLHFGLLYSNASNTFSFKSPTGKSLQVNTSRQPLLVTVKSSSERKNPFIYFSNTVYRFSPVLQNIPPYYFFLNKTFR